MNISPGAYALVGMGAVFAGAAQAPITAIMILFEMTGDYKIGRKQHRSHTGGRPK